MLAGLSLSHGRDHLFRAGLESVGLGIRHNLERIREIGAPVERIVAVGGGTKGNTWLQIVSDISGETQLVPRTTIGASYGDAFLAGLAAGVLDQGALSDWVSVDREVRPNPAHRDLYEGLYGDYLRLYRDSREVVHSLVARSNAP